MSEVSAMRSHLERRFDEQRLVFWHDPDGAYASELGDIELPGVEVVRVSNDEFAVKCRLLHEQPKTKFLVYRSGPVPSGIDNWLLDLELAYGVFTADRASLVRQDLGLTAEGIGEAVHAHEKFFGDPKHVASLRTRLDVGDGPDHLRAKMSAVLLGQDEHTLEAITRTLLIDNAGGSDARYRALSEHGLDVFHWEGVARIYGYRSASPTVEDFVLWLFRQAITGFKSDEPIQLHNIRRDFEGLRYHPKSREALKTLAERAAVDLDFASSIEGSDFRDLVGNDLFKQVDQKIISDLARAVAQSTVAAHEVKSIVRDRRHSLWFEEYRELYTAIESASALLGALHILDLSMQTFEDGLERYRKEWFRIDQLYRQFNHAARTAENSGPLAEVRSKVESFYVNKFLYELGAEWQRQVDGIGQWRSANLRSQTSFFNDHVKPIIRDGRSKAVVIISDALRYEIADELKSLILQEDRFDAELDAILGVVPSYTQLGMAALLPHERIGHSPGGDPVLVDDRRTDGTANRSKVLNSGDTRGRAIQAEEILAMAKDERRELYREHDVLYVYHNRIDAAGDKAQTESQVFEAAEQTLQELVKLVKALTNANATNILITADHGFLYQDMDLADSFYLSQRPQGDEVAVVNRRYVLGRGLKEDPAFKTFTAAQLGLDSDLEAQIPKSVHRLPRPGAGTRFVHGGASLQEIVLPVLVVNKKRKSDIRLVNVDILPDSDKITTGQVVVKLHQKEKVGGKIRPRKLRAGLYVGEHLISNFRDLVFDRESDTRDRYQTVTLLLAKDADDFNGRIAEFRLEELIPNTTTWRTLGKALYTLRRSFTSDFDF